MNTPWTGGQKRHAEELHVPIRYRREGKEYFSQASVWRYPADHGPDGTMASPGPRPRLLVVHGFRGDHHGMEPLADALPEFEVLAPDLPGFGATPPLRGSFGERTPHDVDAYAEVVEQLRSGLGLGEGDVILGHSFGTIVLAAHLRRHAGWAGAVMMCPISDDIFRMPLLPGAAAVEVFYRAGGILPEAVGSAWLRSRLATTAMNIAMGTARQPRIRHFVSEQHRLYFSDFADRATLLEAYRASSRHTVTEYAKEITVPVQLIAGARDQASTPAGQLQLRDALPCARLETIRDVGHLMHYEKPAEAARAVRRFVCDGI